MDIALTAASMLAVKTVAAPAAATRIINRTTLNPSLSFSEPKKLGLYPCSTFLIHKPSRGSREGVIFLTRCQMTPNTDRETENSNVEPNSDSDLEKPELPTSNQPVSWSNSTFSRGLVFDLGPKNSWDGVEIGSPVVKRYLSDDEERWYMWYYGRADGDPGNDSIGLAVSSNGIHWDRGGGSVSSSGDVGSVMHCSEDWWAFDTHSIRPCEVVIMSSSKVRANNAVYWLYYTGFSAEKVEPLNKRVDFCVQNLERVGVYKNDNDDNGEKSRIFKSLPGLAMSQDGRHWARIEGEHHSGALFDVGGAVEWDSLFIASPQVVFHGSGDLRMYYHSFDAEKGQFVVGMARSRDGIRWVKLGRIMGGGGTGAFDEHGLVNARVLRNRRDGNYVMVYEGIAADGERSIGLAASSDGLKGWRRLQDGPVLMHSEDGWDSKGVGSPCLIQIDGDADEWRLYYRGIGNGGQTGIGMAVSRGGDIRSFKRWAGFHL